MDPKIQKQVARILCGSEPQDFHFSKYGHCSVTDKEGMKNYYTKAQIDAALLRLSSASKSKGGK